MVRKEWRLSFQSHSPLPRCRHLADKLTLNVTSESQDPGINFRDLEEFQVEDAEPNKHALSGRSIRVAAMEQDHKPQPYTFDLGHLMCNDPNPIPSLQGDDKEALLAKTAQGCAQGLINQLLTACPIERSNEGELHIKLPDSSYHLPREKPVPKEKEKTKWEKFAEKKGIKNKPREGKLVYDEAAGDWVPKYGYKGKNTGPGDDWLVEVDEKEERRRAKEGEEGKGVGKGAQKGKKMKR